MYRYFYDFYLPYILFRQLNCDKTTIKVHATPSSQKKLQCSILVIFVWFFSFLFHYAIFLQNSKTSNVLELIDLCLIYNRHMNFYIN